MKIYLHKAVYVSINGIAFTVPKGRSEVNRLVYDVLNQAGYV